MADANPGIRHQPLDHPGDFLDVFDPVVDEVNLPASADFVAHGVAHNLFVEGRKRGFDGLAVGRRSRNCGQVTGAHQAELKRSGNRRGRQGQSVDVRFERLELVLHRYAKLLLLVNHQQPQILELHTFADQRMGADQDVHCAVFEFFEGLAERLASLEPVDVVDRDWELTQPPRKTAVVLHRQDGRWHQHRHLFPIGRRLERRANRHFGLPKPHVTTDKPVHRHGLFHVALDRFDGSVLIGRFFEHEARLELVEQVIVGGKREAGSGFPLGIQFQQIEGQFLDPRLRLRLRCRPSSGA